MESELAKCGAIESRTSDHDDRCGGGAYQRSITLQPSGIPTALKLVGQEDLIAMKIAAGSPKYFLDAASCVAVTGGSLNVELVRNLARQAAAEI